MKRVKLLKNRIVNKLITGLSCIALLFIINCDNEQPNPPTPPSFKKAAAKLSFGVGDEDTGISDAEWKKIKKVRVTISTDENGNTPAKYYKDMNDLTGKDLKDVIFPINESEIQFLLEATSKGKDYYVQSFELLDDNEYILYYCLKVKFTLKLLDNPPIVVNVMKISPTFDRVTPEFSVKSINDLIVFFGFQNYTNHYFNSKEANIDLNILFNDEVIHHYYDAFLPFRNAGLVFDVFPVVLPKKRSSYTGTFKVEAKVHDYPKKGATHDFVIPADVSEQIKKGNVLLRVLNHNPKLFVNGKLFVARGKDSIQINLSTDTKVNIPFNITDEDNDEVQYSYGCILIKKSNYEKVGNVVYSGDPKPVFRTGTNNISFSTDKLKTKEGKAIAQDDLKNYMIGVIFYITDKLYNSPLLTMSFKINPETAH